MKRTGIILFAGLAAGLAAHFAWFDSRRPDVRPDLDSQLVWMKTQLRLDAAQYARIKAVHEQLGPHLMMLADEVGRMRNELDAFENARRTSGDVDFVAYGQFVKQRRDVDRECSEWTKRLIETATDVMTPEQKERYLAMLPAALRDMTGRPLQ
jgi:hypothetical protein